jgi:hypothetical protein
MSLAYSQSADASLRILHADRDLVVGAYAHVHMCLYRGDLTLELLELANGFHRRLVQKHGRTAIFGVARTSLALPPQEVRERGAALIRENASHVDGAVVVLPGEGFWASAVRSIVTASFIVARQPYPSHCAKSAEEGASWLIATSPRAGATARGLLEAANQLDRG